MRHDERAGARAHGWVRLSGLPVPAGGPARWRAAVDAARIKTALGVNLATQLVRCRLSRDGVVRLEFRGGGWERSLGPIEDVLRAAIEQRLHRSISELEIVSVLEPPTPDVDPKSQAVLDSTDPRTRLQAIAARIGAGRDRPPGS